MKRRGKVRGFFLFFLVFFLRAGRKRQRERRKREREKEQSTMISRKENASVSLFLVYSLSSVLPSCSRRKKRRRTSLCWRSRGCYDSGDSRSNCSLLLFDAAAVVVVVAASIVVGGVVGKTKNKGLFRTCPSSSAFPLERKSRALTPTVDLFWIF